MHAIRAVSPRLQTPRVHSHQLPILFAPGHARANGKISRRSASVAYSSVGDAGDSLCLLASVLALGTSAAGLLQTAAVATEDQPAYTAVPADPEDDSFMWSISTVVSFIPFFNWMAWLLPALNTEGPQRYYAYSTVYFLPYVLALATVSPDNSGIWPSFIIGAIHMQVEVASQTNPLPVSKALDSLPSVKKWIKSTAVEGQAQIGAFSDAVEYSVKSRLDTSGGTPPLEDKMLNEKEAALAKDVQDLETSSWDEKLRIRNK